jgi:hypothetical protein
VSIPGADIGQAKLGKNGELNRHPASSGNKGGGANADRAALNLTILLAVRRSVAALRNTGLDPAEALLARSQRWDAKIDALLVGSPASSDGDRSIAMAAAAT